MSDAGHIEVRPQRLAPHIKKRSKISPRREDRLFRLVSTN